MDEQRQPDQQNREITVSGPESRALTAQEFQSLAVVPDAAVWFANIDNPNTRRAYQGDVEDFIAFTGIEDPEEFRSVTRA